MSCKKLQPLLTKGREQANRPKPRHSGTPARACSLQKQEAKRKDRMEHSNLEDTLLTSSKSHMEPS